MARKTTAFDDDAPAPRDPAPAPRDPIGKAVGPVPVEVVDIPSTEPYPEGAPSGPITWAEINGLVPVGTGPLAPVPPDPEV